MAKRKNSTALFEVMAAHRARSAAANSSPSPAPPRSSAAPPAGQNYKVVEKPSIFALGKKWVATMLEKRLQPAAPAPAPVETLDPNDPTAGVTAEALMNRRAAATAESTDPTAAGTTTAESRPGGPVTYTTVMPTYGRSSDGENASGPRNKVEFDRDKHQVTLKVRLNTAIISLTALLVVVGAAYIIGKRAAKPASAGASTAQPTPTPQPATPQKVTPGGPLDVGGAKPRSGRTSRPSDNIIVDRSNSRDSTGIQPAAPGGTGSSQLARNSVFEDALVQNGTARRTVGLNYAIIQRFKPEAQESAQEISDFLNAHGVPNTIEAGSNRLGMAADSCAIVGTRGFTARFGGTTEYKEYEAAIHRAAQAFPKKSKIEDKAPEWRKWTE